MAEDTFSDNLAFLRAKAGLTQSELGKMAGVTWSQISRYESGTSRPRKAVLMRLAEALGVHPDTLVRGAVARSERQPEPSAYAYLPLETFEMIEKLAQEEGVSTERMLDKLLKRAVDSGLFDKNKAREK